MSSDVLISVENLSKSYLIGHDGPQESYQSLRDTIVRHGKNYVRKAVDMARGRQIIQGDSVEEFWALKDVSFEVKQGEVLGIIGRNGAGKSTLLKILSRITEPTKGRVVLNGRVSSLLEVGTGFHPELTGRENIFLNGAILGMGKVEIRQKFDEIVDFAGVEKFLDTPVKRYSSGMYVRLAFAVAAHLEPEILIIDEVLAVGDAEFQKKCLGKMQDVAKGGRTVLFVSHNFGAVRSLCASACVLEKGQLMFSGQVGDALSYYLDQSNNSSDTKASSSFSGPLSIYFDLKRIAINRRSVTGTAFTLTDSGEIVIELEYTLAIEIVMTLGLAVFVDGARLFTLIDSNSSTTGPNAAQQRSTFKVPNGLLKRGTYQIGVGVVQPDCPTNWLWNDCILNLQILSDVVNSNPHAHGILNVECESSRTALPSLL